MTATPSPSFAAPLNPPSAAGNRDAAARSPGFAAGGGVSLLSPEQIASLRTSLTNGIARAARRREAAKTDAEFENADAIITDLSRRLARIAEFQRTGRVPSHQLQQED